MPGCQESYLFADEGAGQGNNGPEENATAQDDLSVEAVAQVAENGGRHHEAADENCKKKRRKKRRGSYFSPNVTHFGAFPAEAPVCFSAPRSHSGSRDPSRSSG